MRETSLITWLILLMLKGMAKSSPTARCRPPTFYQEKTFREGAFHRESIENDLLCYDLCWSFSDCTGGSFSKATGLCTLISDKPGQHSRAIPHKGSVVFKADIAVCKPFEDPCAARPCGIGSRCDLLWEDDVRFECNPRGCATPTGFLDAEEQATIINGSVIRFTCPGGKSKRVVCQPHVLKDQFKCDDKQALYMFQDDRLVLFDPETSVTVAIGMITHLKGKRIIDAAVPTTVPNVVMLTTRDSLLTLNVQTFKLTVTDRGNSFSYIDCDGDTCMFSRMKNQICLMNMRSLKQYVVKRGGQKIDDVALDNDKKIVYVSRNGRISSVSFSGQEKVIFEVYRSKRHSHFLLLDRKKQFLYFGSNARMDVFDLTTLRKVISIGTSMAEINGNVLLEGSIYFLSKKRLLKLDLRTLKKTRTMLSHETTGLVVVPRLSTAAG